MTGRLVAVTIFMLGLGACSSSGDEAKINGTWEPVSVPGQGLTKQFRSQDAALVLDDGDISARDGCNDVTFTGTYELVESQFKANLDSFSMAGIECAGGILYYPDVLQRVGSAEIEGERLVLRDSEGALVAEFSKMAES